MNDIYRGTTPTIVLKVTNEDFDMSSIMECHMTIQQSTGKNKKIFDHPTLDNEEKTISQGLSQQDTLDFDYGNINIQVKMKLKNGRVIASRIITTQMNRILEETVL